MSRALRSGRQYDTESEYVPRTRKRKDADKAGTGDGELAVVKRSNKLTFGSLPPSDYPPECPPVIVGTGKKRGIAFIEGAGVKLSPALYRSIYGRPPPIRQPLGLESAKISDARIDTDAPLINNKNFIDNTIDTLHGEATSSGVGAASSALKADSDSSSATVVRAPGTPSESMIVGQRAESSSDEDQIFSTARTSRVLKDTPPADEGCSVKIAQYIVEDVVTNSPERRKRKKKRKSKAKPTASSEPSPSPVNERTQPVSWAEEVRIAEGSPGGTNSLPDLDLSWVNPDWSRSQYISAPPSTNEEHASEDENSVKVNALIYEVDDDYVFSDGEFAEVLKNLRSETSRDNSSRSQTSGAGPSARGQVHKVTVEEIDDEDSNWFEPPVPSESEAATPVGKGKDRARGERKGRRERPSLGVEVDNLRRVDKAKVARRRSSGHFDTSRLEQTPQGFRSGGYLEFMHGEAPRRTRKATPWPTRDDRSHTNSRNVSRAGSERDRDRSRDVREFIAPHIVVSSDPSDPSDDEPSSDGTYNNNRSSRDRKSESESDSGDESSLLSSDDENDVRKLKKKLKREKLKNKKMSRKFAAQARSGYKAQAPKPYNGEPDLDRFELSVFNFDNWSIETKLSRSMSVRNISRFLEGKASVWYMSNVATNIKKFDLDSIYRGLFEYCFPPDFREKLRLKYMQKRQGEQSVQDYFAELELLSQRLKVNAEQHVQRAWDGAAKYIKGEWAIKGIQPENTTIEELRETAIDIERAHKIRRKIEHYDDHRKIKRDRSRSPD